MKAEGSSFLKMQFLECICTYISLFVLFSTHKQMQLAKSVVAVWCFSHCCVYSAFSRGDALLTEMLFAAVGVLSAANPSTLFPLRKSSFSVVVVTLILEIYILSHFAKKDYFVTSVCCRSLIFKLIKSLSL